jgi:hypothetical protein
MNALDLAKRLDKYAEYSGGDWEFYENIAKMLRHQHQQIAALQASVTIYQEMLKNENSSNNTDSRY